MNEVVKYHNDMNTVALRHFNSIEMDIFMSIVSKMRDKELNEIKFTFDQIKDLIKLDGDYTTIRFGKLVDSVYDKLLKTTIRLGNDRKWTKFVLFTKYTVDLDEKTVLIKVHEEFKWVLNELSQRFTRYELSEYVSFKSSYTKEFFRRMKQFRTTGIWKISIEEFRAQLDIPKSYKISEIDKWVLNPIKNELKKDYKLKIKKVYEKQNVGRPRVSGFEFRFITEETPQKTDENIDNTKRLKIYNKETKGSYIYEIVTTFEKNNKYYLKLKKEIDDSIEVREFESLIHFLNFIHKYKYK